MAIMTRSRLKSGYLKNQNTTNWNNYNYQQSFCSDLFQETNFDHFCNMDVKDINGSKRVYRKIKLFFSCKGLVYKQ